MDMKEASFMKFYTCFSFSVFIITLSYHTVMNILTYYYIFQISLKCSYLIFAFFEKNIKNILCVLVLCNNEYMI